MNPSNWKQTKEALATAMELQGDARREFLLTLSDDIRSDVERLLAADESAKSFIKEPILVERGVVIDAAEPDAAEGEIVDDYFLIRKIGSGGMGSVYLAVHSGEGFSQQVALKLIKRGMDTGAVLKRFLMERQILANLEHPNVARMLDGGSTAEGLPYFVMEYVDGEEIREYCNRRKLGLVQRLELFRKICDAVANAHQKLIVHRDLKPSNILVTKDGEPKLLDFGIAKLISPDWNANTNEATITQFRIMTPEYASPEQFAGEATATSTDIYSLGVVLYELLTGERPHITRGKTPKEIAESVLSSDPPKPSTVGFERSAKTSGETEYNESDQTSSGVDQRTRSTSEIVEPRHLQGDLDNIILKAMRREPERRYQSVQEFSEDIRRYLNGLPVNASADSRWYRFGKFFKRHKTALIAGAAVAILLVGSTAVTGWQYAVANRERVNAEKNFEDVRKLANIILFDYYDRIKDLPGTVELRKQLVTDSVRYLDGLAQGDPNDLALQRDLVNGYLKLGEVQFGLTNGNIGDSGGALESYRKALSVAEAVVKHPDATEDDHLKLVEVYGSLAGGLGQTGDIRSDIELKQRALTVLQGLMVRHPERRDIQYRIARDKLLMAIPLSIVGDDVTALLHLEESTRDFTQLLELEMDNNLYKRNLATAFVYQSAMLTRQGDFDAALAAADRSLELNRQRVVALPGQSQPQYDVSNSIAYKGDCLLARRNYKEALATFRTATAMLEEVVRRDPENAYYRDYLARDYHRISMALYGLGERDEAIGMARKAVFHVLKSVEKDPNDVFSRIELAKYNLTLGKALGEREKVKACEAIKQSVELWQLLAEAGQIPKFDEPQHLEALEQMRSCASRTTETLNLLSSR